jgi:hypothetical protein
VAPNLVDLDQSLAGGQKLLDPRPTPDDEILEITVAAIAAGDPDQAGRRASAFLNLNEVAVFGDDDSRRLASLLEDLGILGAEETEILYVAGLAFAEVIP